MGPRELLLLGTLAVAMFNVGVIWLTQIMMYPVWALVGEPEWTAYHDAHKRRLPGVVFLPHGLALLGAVLLIIMRPTYVPGWSVWLAFAIETTMLAATSAYWAPLQIRLSRRRDRQLLRRLLLTHWIRVGLITAFGALLCWMTTLALR